MMPILTGAKGKAISGVVLIALLFLLLRLPGLGMPYHQDEWKNVSASRTVAEAGRFFAHPPLMQMMFVASYGALGTDGMRLLPLIFGAASAVLLYAVVKRRFDKKAAAWSVAIYSVCFYAIFGSLQLDVDGGILPFLFLLAVFAYDRWCASSGGRLSGDGWLALLLAALLLGCLVKLNFVLAIGAIFIDYLWRNRKDRLAGKLGFGAVSLVAFGAAYVAILYLIQYIYPAFSISFMLSHADQFSGDVGRNWTQIAVQGVKAVYYLSPLLLAPLLWIDREIAGKARVFWLYIGLGSVFYFGLFDFSRGALDKYLMFLIVPLSVLVGAVFADLFKSGWSVFRGKPGRPTVAVAAVLVGLAIAILLVVLNLLPQQVVPLYPKTEWFGRVLHGQWSVLTPLNGGSGPLGFYISFSFIAWSYIVAVIVAAFALVKKERRAMAAVAIIFIGLSYNLVFAEELFYGRLNGSAPQVLSEAVAFVSQSDRIKRVMTYNDIGAGNLSAIGKYYGRIYATPDSEGAYRKKFADFDGHYLVIDIPKLYEQGLYYRFFAECEPMFRSTSKAVTGTVYDCSRARGIVEGL